MPASVAATIHARAEGNPFYAIELSRLVDEEGGMGGEVPATVGDVVRRRLARLPRSTVDLLGVSAVVGRDVEMGLLARAADRTFDEGPRRPGAGGGAPPAGRGARAAGGPALQPRPGAGGRPR